MRYVNNYFYISSNSYFFQMNSNFNLIATSAAVSNCMYRQFYYDDSTSLFYVVQEFIYRVDVYNANCKLQSTISLNYNLYSINSFNGNLYVGTWTGQVLVVQNNVFTKNYIISQCSNMFITGIYVDSSTGQMILDCNGNSNLILYDYNGNYLNHAISIPGNAFMSFVDSKGRLITMAANQLVFYY